MRIACSSQACHLHQLVQLLLLLLVKQLDNLRLIHEFLKILADKIVCSCLNTMHKRRIRLQILHLSVHADFMLLDKLAR